MVFLLLLPTFLWPNPIYSFFEADYYCGIRYEAVAALLYAVMIIFALPIIYLLIIYARLVYFIRYQAPQLTRARQRIRAQRDLIVIRRILFIVITLTLPGLVNSGFAIMSVIDQRLSGAYFMYRIQWMGPAVTFFIFGIVLGFIDPQLRQRIQKITVRGHQVMPNTSQTHELQHPSMALATNTGT